MISCPASNGFRKKNLMAVDHGSDQTLLGKFNNTKNNMTYFSDCLVSAFWKIADRTTVLFGTMRTKLVVFVNTVRKFVNLLDDRLWKKWFLWWGTFFDWVLFSWLVFFIPSVNFVRTYERSVIYNALKYFNIDDIRHQYVFREKL